MPTKKPIEHGPKGAEIAWNVGGAALAGAVTELCAIRCKCRLLCAGKTWTLAGAAFDAHLSGPEETA